MYLGRWVFNLEIKMKELFEVRDLDRRAKLKELKRGELIPIRPRMMRGCIQTTTGKKTSTIHLHLHRIRVSHTLLPSPSPRPTVAPRCLGALS